MLLRSLLRRAAVAATATAAGGGVWAPAPRQAEPIRPRRWRPPRRVQVVREGQGRGSRRGHVEPRQGPRQDPRGVASEEGAAGEFEGGGGGAGGGDDLDVEFELPTDPLPPTYDTALDVGPGGRPLFAFTDTFASFSRRDANAYVDFTYAPLLFSLAATVTIGFECGDARVLVSIYWFLYEIWILCGVFVNNS